MVCIDSANDWHSFIDCVLLVPQCTKKAVTFFVVLLHIPPVDPIYIF